MLFLIIHVSTAHWASDLALSGLSRSLWCAVFPPGVCITLQCLHTRPWAWAERDVCHHEHNINVLILLYKWNIIAVLPTDRQTTLFNSGLVLFRVSIVCVYQAFTLPITDLHNMVLRTHSMMNSTSFQNYSLNKICSKEIRSEMFTEVVTGTRV